MKQEPAAPVLDYAREPKRPSPILQWGLMLLIAFVLQSLFLPCLCYDGIIKMRFAYALDILFMLRAAFAILRKEQGKAWLVYGLILVTSAIWITFLVEYVQAFLHKP